MVGEHGHPCGDGSISSRCGREVGSDEAREDNGAVAGALRGAQRPRDPHRAQRLPSPDDPHLHPHVVPVVRGLEIDADDVVGRGQRDHELGLEAQRDLVLVVAGGPVELDAEAEVAVHGGDGRGGGGGRRGGGGLRGRGRGRGGVLIGLVGEVAVVEGEVEDLGAALPAQAP